MPGRKVDIDEIKRKRQKIVDAHPKLAKASEDWNKEYEFRKKLTLAREEMGMTQKQLQEISEEGIAWLQQTRETFVNEK